MVKVLPPAEFTLPCPVPIIDGETTEAVIEAYLDRGAALKSCNAQLAKLRAWLSGEVGEADRASN